VRWIRTAASKKKKRRRSRDLKEWIADLLWQTGERNKASEPRGGSRKAVELKRRRGQMRRTSVRKDFDRSGKVIGNFKAWIAILLVLPVVTGVAGIGHSAAGAQSDVQKVQLAQATPPSKGESEQKKTYTFLALPAGTSVYTIAVGQGLLLNKKLPNYKFFVQPSSSAHAVPIAVGKGEADLMTLPAPTAYWAYKGVEDYSTPIPSLRVLQSGHDVFFGLVVRSDSGINSIKDLKGKRVTIDLRASRLLSKLGELMLEANGLDPKKDITPLKAEFDTQAMGYLLEKRTDAIISGLVGSKWAEAEKKASLTVLPLEEDKIFFLRQHLPVVFPAKTVTGMTGIKPGIPVVVIPAILGTNKDMDEGMAYLIVKTLLENQKELIPTHRDFEAWSPDRAVKNLGMPYHPGAVRYYKEKKLWTPEIEQLQRSLLGK
jgi:TRAP transporter TAXI family solute receptor